MSLSVQKRALHLSAAAVIAGLLALLAWREGVQRWQAFAEWQALAQSAAALQVDRSLSADYLRQAATARQIRLDSLEAGSEGWLLTGQVKDAKLLQDWLLHLQNDGAEPLSWGLQREESGLRFELAVRR